MIRIIKQMIADAILHEKLLIEFAAVYRKKDNEKKYKIKLTQSNIELLRTCYQYGIDNEDKLLDLIRQKFKKIN